MTLSSNQSASKGRLINIIGNYQSHVAKTLWGVTLLAWLMSLAYATQNDTWILAIVVGGALTAVNTLLVFGIKSRYASMGVGVILMVFVSLHVHQLKGMFEVIFGYIMFIASLFAFLDWRPIVAAATAAAVLHVGVDRKSVV